MRVNPYPGMKKRLIQAVKLVWATVTNLIEPVDASVDGHVDGVRIPRIDPPSSQVIEYGVALDDDRTGIALCFVSLVGSVAVGDRVLLNTTAVDLGLGTGGRHMIVARVDPDTVPRGVALDDPAQSGGHIMKLRYTPMQRDVLSVEAQESPHHKIMEQARDLDHIPVVCCGLHSQVPLVAAAIKARASHLRVGYVMTDQAALSLDLSKVVGECKANGLIDVTVATGQAFGGDLEAINVHSGMLAACHVGGCDVLIVAIGPGVAGTGTPFGHGGVAQGEAINAVTALHGLPIACLRMSFADERERHRVISHHTVSALEHIALGRALIAVPHLKDDAQRAALEKRLDEMDNPVGHEAMVLEEEVYDERALKGIRVTTMRRGYDQDPVFFEAAFAAGTLGAYLACES